MANRFMYIPMIGLFILLVWECDARIRGRYSGLLKALLCVAAMVYLVSLTRVQNIYYSNSYALFTRAGEITEDNFVACNNIGDALMSLNRTEEAGSYFAKAMALNPKYDDAIYNYALYLAKKGEPLNAADHFSRVIKVNPHYIGAYVNLALLQYQRGDIGEAEKLLLKALELDPDDGYAHNNLGIIRADQGKSEEAIHHYLLAAKNKPALIQARINLAEAYEKDGHLPQAIVAYEALSRMMPDNRANLFYRIAGLYALQGLFGECKSALEIALQQGLDVFIHLESDDKFKDFRKSTHYAALQETQRMKTR